MKTPVYWVGLIILCFASVFLFAMIWVVAFMTYTYTDFSILRSPIIPAIIGGVVFIILGLYMIREGKNT